MNEISHVISSSTHKNLTASYSCYIMNIILTTNLILNNNLIGDLNKVKNMKQAIFLETMIYVKKYIEEKINEDIDLGRLDKDKPVISEINRIINLNSKISINEMGEEKYLCPDWVLFDYKEIYNTGYSVESLISALHSYYHSNNSLEAIVRAANLYGDADTIAAITGQIAGSFYGIKEQGHIHIEIKKELRTPIQQYLLFFKKYASKTTHHRVSFEIEETEQGLNIVTIKELLGHAHITTTMIYLHVAQCDLQKPHSPLDRLYATANS